MTAATPDTVRSLLPEPGPSPAGNDAPALQAVEGGSLGHRALGREVDRLAGVLAGAGIRPGDRVAIVLPNGPEMALTLLAVMSCACAAPLNPKYTTEEFAFYLGDLHPVALVTLDGHEPVALERAGGEIRRVRVVGRGLDIDVVPAVNREQPGRPPSPARAPSADDQVLVLHTSGTTSRPKIVPLRQKNLATSARNIAGALGLTARDRSLNVMPLFHIHGIMAGMLAPIGAGGSMIAAPGFNAFKFGRWLDELEPTYYSAVPTIHQMVLARTRPAAPTSLRFVRSSSSALPAAVFEGLRDRFAVPVIEAYGMSEASHQMTVNPLPPGVAKQGSVGLPAGIEVAIVDENKRFLPANVRGEVVVRGATVIDGYENDPSATAAAFFDGWLRTGDEGLLDGDGYLRLTGRLKEQINRGGEKVSPLEVEEVLLAHSSVAQAAVFAVPDARLGEEVGAVVVLHEGSSSSEAQLREHVHVRLAAYKVPKTVLVVDEIPKGPTGKIQRIGLAAKLGLA